MWTQEKTELVPRPEPQGLVSGYNTQVCLRCLPAVATQPRVHPTARTGRRRACVTQSNEPRGPAKSPPHQP